MSSTTSLARLKIEAERAALPARVEALKQKLEIDREEAVLTAKREEWEKQTAIAATSAKLEVLTVKEPAHNTSADLMNGMAACQRPPGQNIGASFSVLQLEHGNVC